MTRPRKALIALADTPYYHIVSRCVRQAFLCGVDRFSGRSYEHRRQWIVDRIRLLSSLFAIDICAYAVMNNHYHLVLKLCPEQFDDLTEDDIIERWCTLFKGPLLIQRYRAGESLSAAERNTVGDIARVWRNKLTSISWFMRCLNQPIARQANIEDGCTGKFWECRFTSQALRTEEALVSCMAYVDLNPVRAGLSTRPEDAEFTSIKERVQPAFDFRQAIADQLAYGEIQAMTTPPKPLLRFDGTVKDTRQTCLPLSFENYLELVDWTGRILRHDKRGYIASSIPPILRRLRIDPEQWLINTARFEAIHTRRFSRTGSSFGSG